MSRSALLILLGALVFATACSFGESSSISQGTESLGLASNEKETLRSRSTNCSVSVHEARVEDYPVLLAFVRELPHAIFLCEYWRGEPIRVFGKFGQKLKLTRRDGGKQTVYAGVGYVLADLTDGVRQLLENAALFENFATSSGDVEVRALRRLIEIPGYGLTRAIFVEVSVRAPVLHRVKNYTVGVLSLLDFPFGEQKYRAFLWVQGYRVTVEAARSTFGELLLGIKSPNVQEAGLSRVP